MNAVSPQSMLVLLFMVLASKPFSVSAESLSPHQQLARDILAELVEINPAFDADRRSVRWAAQVIWHFLAGLAWRQMASGA